MPSTKYNNPEEEYSEAAITQDKIKFKPRIELLESLKILYSQDENSNVNPYSDITSV